MPRPLYGYEGYPPNRGDTETTPDLSLAFIIASWAALVGALAGFGFGAGGLLVGAISLLLFGLVFGLMAAIETSGE